MEGIVPDTILALAEAASVMNAEHEKLNNKYGSCEHMINNIYHILETESLSGVEMIKLTVKLRETLRERRTLKNQLRFYQSFEQFKNVEKKIKDVSRKCIQDNKRYINESKQAYKQLKEVL